MKADRLAVFGAVAATLIATSCSRGAIQELRGEQLFSLSLGKLEDQIDLFEPDGQATVAPDGQGLARRNRIHMRDGLFYIANGNAGKIMVFSSYGELVFLLYNPATNPKPMLADEPHGGETVSTRGSVPYPFQDIGEIGVASDKTLYVEDEAPAGKVVKDGEDGVLDRVVLRFDRRGAPEGFLGQEGVGGTPFPPILGLYVTQRDQPVVVCRLVSAWEVFWFSREGVLLYQVRIDGDHLPPPPAKGLTSSLVNLLPDQRDPSLYLLVYYYAEGSEGRQKAGAGSSVTALVYRFDIRKGQYSASVELPANPPLRQRVGFKTVEVPRPPYDLLGIGADERLYLLGYADSNLYQLAVLEPGGRIRKRASMVIEDSELTYRDTHLAASGIIYGLLCDRATARVSWWRADQLLHGEGS